MPAEHPPVGKPRLKFAPHPGVTVTEHDATGLSGPKGGLLLAVSSDYTPFGAVARRRAGYWVKRVDPAGGPAEDFFGVEPEALGPPGLACVTTKRPRRPVDIRDGTGRAGYVVDIGPVHVVTTAQEPAARPFPGTVRRVEWTR